MDLQKNESDGREVISSFRDQLFLLNSIMGTYLGPDVLDYPRSSAFERKANDSPPYLSTDLGPSYISVAMLENLYYYVLRNAHPSLVLKPNMLHKYLKGSLCLPNSKQAEETLQFTSFFPLDLHEQIWYPASFRVVKGVVFIDDPMTSDLDERDLQKFKSLCYMGSFKIDKKEFINFEHDHQDGDSGDQNCLDNGSETITGHGINGNHNPFEGSQQKFKRRWDVVTMGKQCCSDGDLKRTCVSDEPAMMSVLSIRDMEKCISESDASIVISGTAGRGKAGPPVGVVDVGVGKVAYYFRVALPGVRKDYCMFSIVYLHSLLVYDVSIFPPNPINMILCCR